MSPADRPRFAANFPESGELDAALGAFERGDYRLVNELGEALVKQSPDPAIKDAARELMLRTGPDPVVKKLILMAALLLVLLSGFWMVFAKPPTGAEPRAPSSATP